MLDQRICYWHNIELLFPEEICSMDTESGIPSTVNGNVQSITEVIKRAEMYRDFIPESLSIFLCEHLPYELFTSCYYIHNQELNSLLQ